MASENQVTPIDLSIVIPAYHERDRINDSVKALVAYLKEHSVGRVELVVVSADDDGTAKIAQEQAGAFAGLQVITPPDRAGKGRDVRLGMLAAQGRYVMFMDADLATPLVHLEDVRRLMELDKPVGICVRDLETTHTGIRKLISEFGNILVRGLLLPGIKDSQCGFKVFDRAVAKKVFERQLIVGWGFDMEVLAIARKLGYSIDFIQVNDWHDPKPVGLVGDSSAKVALQVFGDLIKIRWNLLLGRYRVRVGRKE